MDTRLILMAALALSASAADVTGTWRVTFLGDPARWPKVAGPMTFDLKSDGQQLTGMAHVPRWVGDVPISDGKIEGDRISFVAIGKMPWWSSGDGHESRGYPRLTFTGTIDGKLVKLRLVTDSVMIYGNDGAAHEYELAGKKISD